MRHTSQFNRLERFCPILVIATAVALSAHTPPALAQTLCLQNQYAASGFSQSLNCTANDVRVAKAINTRDPVTGATVSTCQAGQKFSFLADFLVQTSSTSSRSNIGLYMNLNATSALTGANGTCEDNIISPQHPTPCGGAGQPICLGSNHYDELDPAPDNCGDSTSQDPTVCLDANNNVVACGSGSATQTFTATQIVTVEIDNFTCPAAGTTAQLPNCTSWQVPGKTLLCDSPSPSFPFERNAVPGSPSKCNCGTVSLPIISQSPQVSVAKTCNTAITTGAPTFFPTASPTSCNAGAEGGLVTYSVGIKNTSNFGDIIVDQICDSVYGTVFRASSFTGAACSTPGSIPSGNTTCSALDIASGSVGSCTFTASQGENLTVSDTIRVVGHGASSGSTFGPSGSNSVQVVSQDAASTATVTKSLVDTTNGCATVRYNVDVANTSAADEVLSLSTLTDTAYGDITKSGAGSNPLVLGTTCGVASGSPGLGSLSGSTGAGSLPATLDVSGTASHYTCQFDAQFCGALGSITKPDGTSCTGIQHTNKVTGTLTGDEGETVTQAANTFTVDECFTTFTSSTTP